MKSTAAGVITIILIALCAGAASGGETLIETFNGAGPFSDIDGNIPTGFDLPFWLAPVDALGNVSGLGVFDGDSLNLSSVPLVYTGSSATLDFYNANGLVYRDFSALLPATSLRVEARLENFVPGPFTLGELPDFAGLFVRGDVFDVQATYLSDGNIVAAVFIDGGPVDSVFRSVTPPMVTVGQLDIVVEIRPDAFNGGTVVDVDFRLDGTAHPTLTIDGAFLDRSFVTGDAHGLSLGHFRQYDVPAGLPDPMIESAAIDLANLELTYSGCDAPELRTRDSALASVRNVEVDGQLYDVHLRDRPFVSLFSELVFRDSASARRASQALEAALVDGPAGNFDTEPSASAGCESTGACEILTPWAHDPAGNTVTADGVLNQVSLIDGFTTATLADTLDLASDPGRVWAFWAALPPSDCDADSVMSDEDNCLLVANADQRDTDDDGIGNACDPDIAPGVNDCSVNFLDLNAMKTAFFSNPASPNWNEDADLNGDDIVNFGDLNTMKARFFDAPGPSGLKNFCEYCEPDPTLPLTDFYFDASLSEPVFQPFREVEEFSYRTVFRSLGGRGFTFKVTDEFGDFECDTPPTPLPLGGVNTYSCGPADGSPAIDIEIPAPGCYVVRSQLIDIAEIAVGLQDYDDL